MKNHTIAKLPRVIRLTGVVLSTIIATGAIITPKVAYSQATIICQHVGPDVRCDGGGSLSLTGVTQTSGALAVAFIRPFAGEFIMGGPGSLGSLLRWEPIQFPTSFGTGGLVNADAGSEGSRWGLFSAGLYLPPSYVGGPLPNLTSIYSNATFATLGITPGTYEWSWGVGNPDQTITLNAVALPATLAGDYNDDDVVDAADYTEWLDNLGAPEGTLPNDADGGTIGQAQYATWKANFGNILSATATGSSPDSVPEPSTLLLSALCMLTVGVLRNKKSETPR